MTDITIKLSIGKLHIVTLQIIRFLFWKKKLKQRKFNQFFKPNTNYFLDYNQITHNRILIHMRWFPNYSKNHQTVKATARTSQKPSHSSHKTAKNDTTHSKNHSKYKNQTIQIKLDHFATDIAYFRFAHATDPSIMGPVAGLVIVPLAWETARRKMHILLCVMH